MLAKGLCEEAYAVDLAGDVQRALVIVLPCGQAAWVRAARSTPASGRKEE
jgi:hypothetical protein